ncbi:excisionase family DNA-binding protein [Rhodoblastus sp.]|jgi:excisionase family DNA binding protein|uniref:excisionase family DNA-binding protein n=1 Tax=Rhodoblastus sp. TaxID=1962975 RepID=UPI003FD6DE53
MRRTHIDPIIPSDQDAVLAGRARHAIDAGENLTVRELPPIIGLLLMDALKQTEAGNALTLVPVETEITTQQAADLLNVSRPYLVTLVENGTLPARMVGKHRRLALRDVLAYKADHFAKRSKVLDEMLALDQELGLI